MATATSTIVFVDMVGSTTLRARLGEEAADRVFRAHQRALGQLVEGHLGRVVKTAGDGIMAAFDSATDAVRAAVAVQRSTVRDPDGVRLRVGAAAGDVSWEDGDCFGLPVATAARLESHAEAGQILVSSMVRFLAGDRSAAPFGRVGMLELKGLPEPVEAFEVGWSPSAEGSDEAGRFPVPCPAAIAAAPTFAFVGREAERHELEVAWAAAQAGERRTVLIGGETGAGKTRLAFEFARRCAAEGAAVLLGVCDTELAMPYQPWVQVVDHLVRAMPGEVAASMVEDLSEVSVLVPQLERVVPGLRRPPPADPETERYRLFSAVDAILADAARRWPAVVVVDDLHWAGPQTLALLRHLARSGTASRLLIVGTFRDTGDEITDPLAGCLADLRRTESTGRLRLGGLDGATVERFVASAVGHDLDGDLRRLAAVLAQHSGGNAFYVGELWRHVVASGVVAQVNGRWAVRRSAEIGVPDSVREVVADRVARLSPRARRVLELAAIAGQRVELRVLHAAVDGAEDEVGAGLDELVEAKLFIEVGGLLAVYQFAHAIVRDTVERSIPSSARAHLHLQVAQAYEVVYEADRRPVLPQLARHFTSAAALGGAPKAVYYLRRAASQALRSVAYDEATVHLEAALELEPSPSERVDLLLDLGEAKARHGLHREAMARFADAFREARDAGLVAQAAQAAAGFDQAVHLPGLPGAPAVEIVSAALALLGDEDSPLRTRLQASLARALALAGRREEATRVGEAALAAARLQADPEVLIAALQSAQVYSLEPWRCVREAQEMIALADQTHDPWTYAYAKNCEVRGLLALGQVNRARSALDAHRQAAERGRFVVFRYMGMVYEVMFAVIDGRFDDAERLAERARDFGAAARTESDAGVYGVHMYVIRREQGRLDEVAPVLRLAAALQSDQPVWRPGLAALFADVGMLDDARREFELLAPDGFAAVPRDAMWPGCLTFLAEVCVALGDSERATVLYRELEQYRGLTMMVGYTICLGPAERLMGSLAALAGRRSDAEAHFAAALDLAERCGSPLWTAHVQHDWAAALGDRPDLRAAALGTATALGMTALAERCRASAGTSATSTAAKDRAAPELPGGLSVREVAVLRLIAAGLSNREIGEQLFISHNTVANHIRSILQKTGSTNRAEATAYAARHGLLDPERGR